MADLIYGSTGTVNLLLINIRLAAGQYMLLLPDDGISAESQAVRCLGAGQPVSRLPSLLQKVVIQGMDQLQALLSQAMRCSIDLQGEPD